MNTNRVIEPESSRKSSSSIVLLYVCVLYIYMRTFIRYFVYFYLSYAFCRFARNVHCIRTHNKKVTSAV